MNPQQRPGPEQGLAISIGLMLLGVVICIAWMFASAPRAIPLVAERITGAHLVLLAVLILFGLIATSIFARLAVACVQLLFLLTKIGLLVLVVVAGVFAWRWVSTQNLPQLATTPVFESVQQPQPAVEEDPEERRRALEEQLHQLDRNNGKSWWGK